MNESKNKVTYFVKFSLLGPSLVFPDSVEDLIEDLAFVMILAADYVLHNLPLFVP